MTTTEAPGPEITCQRCGTRTAWAPYCPTCGAYLEFAGVPAWRPDGPLTDPSAESAHPAEPAQSAESAQPPEPDIEPEPEPDESPAPPTADDAPAVLPVPPVLVVTTMPPDPAPSWEERQLARGLPFGMHWARRSPLPGVESPPWWHVKRRLSDWSYRRWPLPALPHAEWVPPAHIEAPGPVVSPPAAVRHTPQAELPRAVEAPQARTRALLVDSSSSEGDVSCPVCRHQNAAGSAFCAFCGTTLPDAVIAPVQVAVATPGSMAPTDDPAALATTLRPSPPRRRDWLPWVLGASGIALIGILLFLFLGPPQQETRSFVRTAYRTVVEFINPYSGTEAPISSISATSSLEGVSPDALQDTNARTFWASAPSTDYGAGTAVAFEFTQPVTIDRIVMSPGIQNGQLSPTVLATPAKVTLTFSDETSTQVTFDPLTTEGPFQQVRRFDDVTTTSVIMTIDTIYPPSLLTQQQQGVGEVAISVVKFLQTPDSPGEMTTDLVR